MRCNLIQPCSRYLNYARIYNVSMIVVIFSCALSICFCLRYCSIIIYSYSSCSLRILSSFCLIFSFSSRSAYFFFSSEIFLAANSIASYFAISSARFYFSRTIRYSLTSLRASSCSLKYYFYNIDRKRFFTNKIISIDLTNIHLHFLMRI